MTFVSAHICSLNVLHLHMVSFATADLAPGMFFFISLFGSQKGVGSREWFEDSELDLETHDTWLNCSNHFVTLHKTV